MLEPSHGLTPVALAAIADLESRAVAVDGGRLKLEFGVLRTRPTDEVSDLLWWQGDRLLGFLGVYAFGAPTVELAGMVDPAARRQGIATALVDAALAFGSQRGWSDVLLVTPRNDAGGRSFAEQRGGVLEHSEHAMVLVGEPTDGPTDPRVTLRDAGPADREARQRILGAAFGYSPDDDGRAPRDGERVLMIDYDAEAVGTVRTTHGRGADGGVSTGGIYGFAVDAAWRGRGIGRDVLRRTCAELLAAGSAEVGLEVAVENEHALGLYTSVGFTRVLTEDYYRLPLAPST